MPVVKTEYDNEYIIIEKNMIGVISDDLHVIAIKTNEPSGYGWKVYMNGDYVRTIEDIDIMGYSFRIIKLLMLETRMSELSDLAEEIKKKLLSDSKTTNP